MDEAEPRLAHDPASGGKTSVPDHPLPIRPALLAFTLALAHTLATSAHGAVPEIVVDAGPHARESALAGFNPPDGIRTDQSWELRAADGSVRTLQFADGHAWFIETKLPAGATRRYQLHPSQGASPRDPQATSTAWIERDLEVRVDGRPVLRYLAHEGRRPRPEIPPIFERGGYLHPVLTPSGRIVTDDYPANHVHHHGIWAAWTKTLFDGRAPDFWNMGEGKARVDFLGFDGFDSGPVLSRFSGRQVYLDTLVSPPVRVLEDTWQVTVVPIRLPDAPPFHLFDLRSEQRIVAAQALELPKYYYGGVGLRGPWNWNGKANARYLDSNGVTNRVTANETRARWYWLGGQVTGELAGIAVLGHPENFRAPQPLRVHPNEPFVCWAPSQGGDWSIQPGSPYVSRYRYVAFDGEPDPGLLDRLWSDFAEPPTVQLKAD